MNNWKIKRFALFTGPEYEVSLGLGGYVHSTNTLAQMKKWVAKNIENKNICFEEWQIADLKKGEIIFDCANGNEFVKEVFRDYYAN